MATPIDVNSVPDSVLLPMAVVKPGLLDWVAKGRLSAAQKILLDAFNVLSFSRKAQLLHGMLPTESIPAYKIKQLYEEQMREQARGASSSSLTDTTKSELA